MPLNKREEEINKAVLQIELAKRDFSKLPIPTDSQWEPFKKGGLRHLRSAASILNKILTEPVKSEKQKPKKKIIPEDPSKCRIPTRPFLHEQGGEKQEPKKVPQIESPAELMGEK